MNCQEIRALLPAHHDAELDAANTLLVEQHIADCPRCFSVLQNHDAMGRLLHESSLRHRAPAELRRQIRAEISRAAKRPAAPLSWSWPRLGLAAAAMIALCLGLQFWPSRTEDQVLSELASSHVRSLMAGHLTDVASTDQHTVKPWFVGKLDFAPPVKDLRDSGFPLIGGRLDYVQSHAVAALIYSRGKHPINLFVWPSSAGDSAPKTRERQGYHFIQWSSRGMTFWAVSDLNEKELMDFATLISAP